MPPSSRKRNKGKERKAKQLAKKEETDRLDAHSFWWGLCYSKQCDHGQEMVILAEKYPVSSFMDQFYVNLHHKGMTVAQNLRAIFQSHKDILNDESCRKFALDILVHIGTNMMLNQERYDIANALCVAQSIVALEHYEHYDGGSNVINFVINKRVVRSKWRDMQPELITNERDAIKFYRKRTSCKCLKKMHLEARKTMPKLSNCYNCDKHMERVALSVCSRCMVSQYCSRECQVADWPSHKRHCDLTQRAERTATVRSTRM